MIINPLRLLHMYQALDSVSPLEQCDSLQQCLRHRRHQLTGVYYCFPFYLVQCVCLGLRIIDKAKCVYFGP